jgi:hypothetical protein
MQSQAADLAILSYESTPAVRTRRRSWLLIALSLPAVLIPLLDFAYHFSPLDAVQHGLDLIPFSGNNWSFLIAGSGFFIAWIIVLWNALTLLTQPTARTRAIFWIFAAFGCIPFLFLGAFAVDDIHSRSQYEMTLMEVFRNIWPFGLDMAATLLGLLTARRLVRRSRPGSAVTAALIGAFIGHTLVYLMGFMGDHPNPGYWVTLAMVLVWLPQLIYLHWLAWRPGSYDRVPTPGDIA